MTISLDKTSLDMLFNVARSFSHWLDKPVTLEQLEAVYDLMKMGPTAANCCPARILFIRGEQAKQRLRPHLNEGNVDKCMSAPVVAVIGMDMAFYEQLPRLFPHTDARSWFAGNQPKIEKEAFRNSTLQAGYFILAARSLGLDTGPMSGFNAQTLDQEFFPDGQIRSHLIVCLGYGDRDKLYPRQPRLDFDEACKLV